VAKIQQQGTGRAVLQHSRLQAPQLQSSSHPGLQLHRRAKLQCTASNDDDDLNTRTSPESSADSSAESSSSSSSSSSLQLLASALETRQESGADVAGALGDLERSSTQGDIDLDALDGSWEIVFSTALLKDTDAEQKPWYKFFQGYMPRAVKEVVVIDKSKESLQIVTDIGSLFRVQLNGRYTWSPDTSLMAFSFYQTRLGPFEFESNIPEKTYAFFSANGQVAAARSSTGALTGLYRVESPFKLSNSSTELDADYYKGMFTSPLKDIEAMTDEEKQIASQRDNLTPTIKFVGNAVIITGVLTLAFLASNGLIF